MRKQKYYQVSTSGRTAEINIYGDITSFADVLKRWYGDNDNITEVSAYSILKEIQGLDVDVINVYINSYGGEVSEALAIYSELKRHQAVVHTFCDGFACSAATIVFCAGDTRTMGSIALMMIHNCMTYIGYANSEELRKAAEDNDKINQSSIEAYKAVAKIPEEKIRELMDNTTWLTARECLDYGFATDIADMEGDERTQQSAFGLIREAVLKPAKEEAYDAIMKKLDSLEGSVIGLRKAETKEPVFSDQNEQAAGRKEKAEGTGRNDHEGSEGFSSRMQRYFGYFIQKEEERKDA